MRRTIFVLPTALIVASLLGGCNFLHKHFDRKEPAYQKSTQARPLEVPPDLDMPSNSAALVIPPATASAPATAASASTSPPPVSLGTEAAAAGSASPAGVVVEGGALSVADTVESTWARVGLALERSGAASISSRDEVGHTYAVVTSGQAATQPGWLKRAVTLGRAKGTSAANVPLTVRVSADGAGSRVSVEGAADEVSAKAARAVLATLRQRLS